MLVSDEDLRPGHDAPRRREVGLAAIGQGAVVGLAHAGDHAGMFGAAIRLHKNVTEALAQLLQPRRNHRRGPVEHVLQR